MKLILEVFVSLKNLFGYMNKSANEELTSLDPFPTEFMLRLGRLASPR